MPDLAFTDAERDARFKRIGAPVAAIADLREVRDRFQKERDRVTLELEVNGVLSQFRLSGVRIGENTDADGIIFLRVFDETPGAGEARIRGYTTTADRTANTNHVFNAEGNDGATLTVDEANSSGLDVDGDDQVVIGTVAGNDSDAQLRCLLDWRIHFRNVYGGEVDDRIDGDQAAFDAMLDACDVAVDGISSALDAFGDAFDALMLGQVRDEIRSGERNVAVVGRSVDDGAVTIRKSGVLVDLARAMALNSGGSGEIHVLPFDLTASSVTFVSSNNGVFSMSAPTLLNSARAGRVTFRLQKPFDASGAETFKAILKLDGLSGPGAEVEGEGVLTVGKTYRSNILGIGTALMSRSFTKTGDAGNADLAAASAVSAIDGETTGNTAAGKFTVQVVANGSNWDFEFYKTTDTGQLTTANLVAKATNIATGAVFTATEQNGSGLTVSWQAGSGPTTTNTVTLDINQGEIVETDGELVPDSAFYDVTKGTNRGRFQDIIAKLRLTGLNTDASASVDDSFARANTVAEILQEP